MSIASRLRLSAALSVRYSLTLAAATLAVALFRLGMNRIFDGYQNPTWYLSLVPVPIFGLEWFILMSGYAILSLRGRAPSVTSDTVNLNPSSARKPNSTVRLFGLSAVIAVVLALSAWLALDFSDSVFQSRLLPWTVPLIELQRLGFTRASRLFPAGRKGSILVCEWYKWLPAFVAANAAAYLPVAFIGAYLYRRSARLKTVLQRGLHSVVRWGACSAIVGLCLRLFVAKWWPGASTPLGQGHAGRMLWVAVDGVTGIIVLVLFLAMPFYIYQGLGVTRSVTETRRYLADFTWMASLYGCSLVLASVYGGS
jgi:hypothetical protein